MSESNVEIEGFGADEAVMLLAAAEDLGLEASVVLTSSTGFVVPKEVADKAGLDYASDDEGDKPAKKTAAKKAASKPQGKE